MTTFISKRTWFTIGVLAGLLLAVALQPRRYYGYDYQIDIFDTGDGKVKLYDLRDDILYKVPFDSLEKTIDKLNL